MHVQNDTSIAKWVGDTLDQMRMQSPPMVEDTCVHCGLVIRYPLIVRKSDIELFQMMMACAFEIMDKYEITGNLLADIRAQCLISMAAKGQGDRDEFGTS